MTAPQKISNQEWLTNRLIGIATLARDQSWADDDPNYAHEARAILDQVGP